MTEKPKLWRKREPNELVEVDADFITSEEFDDTIFYLEECDVLPQPQTPTGRWYCHTEECVVRTATIYCKLFGDKLPQMKCPACQKPMELVAWLKEEAMVPYKESDGKVNA